MGCEAKGGVMMGVLGRGMLRLAAAAAGGDRLSILIYHRVVERPDAHRPEDLDAAAFAAQVATLRACCNVLPLDEAVRRLRTGTLPPRAAAITFDDGYLDNHAIAQPILAAYALPATFFIATGFLEGGCMWNDRVIEALRAPQARRLSAEDLGLGTLETETAAQRRAAVAHLIERLKYREPRERGALVEEIASRLRAPPAPELMMRPEHLASLARSGMSIGAHTVTHPILARIDEASARREIHDSRATLEAITGVPVPLFAYPNGKPDRDYGARDVSIVRELGFEAAVTTEWGAAAPDADVHQLPRFTPWDRARPAFVARLAHNYRRPVRGAGPQPQLPETALS
jgi:peptidoglycan/xylan/chitin deacetylase (PgdA/CDA1 family)